MKTGVIIIFVLITQLAFAQKSPANYSSIDWNVLNIEASTPAELAQKLTSPYKTDLEKVRAIFSWIAQHISYGRDQNSSTPRRTKNHSIIEAGESVDTTTVLIPLNELVAEDILKKRTAFCYGYSRLFQCLCEDAGILCEVINGYARGDSKRIGTNFRTNHSWNAVLLDSNWYLVDVTWASGYFTYSSNEFVRHFDDQYFLTSPGQFALDHFPDDLRWSLLQQTPTPDEFRHSPYKGRCFVKYNITAYSPSEGVIHVSIGDTVYFHVQTDLAADRHIGGGSLDDSIILAPLQNAVYCEPINMDENKTINYRYVVQSPLDQWVQLVYNGDMILRYKLDIRNETEHN